MALSHRFRLLFPAAVLAGLASASASPSLSVSDSVSQASTGSTGRRSLLQTKRGTWFHLFFLLSLILGGLGIGATVDGGIWSDFSDARENLVGSDDVG